MRFKKFIASIAVVSMLFGGVVSASGVAQVPLKFSIVDGAKANGGFYEINAERGKTYTFDFFVKNTTKAEKQYIIYYSDVIPALGGGADFRERDDKNTLVGGWMSGERGVHSIKPGATQKYQYTVKVPSELKAGSYNGAVVVTEAFDPNSKGGEGEQAVLTAKKRVKMGIQIVLNVDKKGADSKIELPDPEFGYYESGQFFVHIPFDNVGTQIEKPAGEIKLLNSNGDYLENVKYQMDSVYATTIGKYPYSPKLKLNAGEYKLVYSAEYGDNKKLEKEFSFTVTQEAIIIAQANEEGKPLVIAKDSWWSTWWWVVVLGVLVLFLLLFLLFRRKKDKDEEEEYVQEGNLQMWQ